MIATTAAAAATATPAIVPCDQPLLESPEDLEDGWVPPGDVPPGETVDEDAEKLY